MTFAVWANMHFYTELKVMEGWQNICISDRSLVNRPVSVTLSLSLCCMIVDKFEENRMLTCIVLWLTSSQDEATAGWVKQMTASALLVSSATTTLTSSCRTASTEPSLPSRLLHHSARRSPHPCLQSSPLPHHQRKLPLNSLRSTTLHHPVRKQYVHQNLHSSPLHTSIIILLPSSCFVQMI